GGAGLARETNQQVDGSLFARWRAALEPRLVAARVAGAWGRWIREQRRQLGMNQERQTEARDDRQRLAEIRLGDVLEFRHTGRREKALEPEDAGPRERLEFRRVARNDASPEADVDSAAPGGRLALRLEPDDRCRRRNAVERHVHERRHSAGRRRA